MKKILLVIVIFNILSIAFSVQAFYPEKDVPVVDEALKWKGTNGSSIPNILIQAKYFSQGTSSYTAIKHGIKFLPTTVNNF